MADLTEKQLSRLASYKHPTNAIPGSSRLVYSTEQGYFRGWGLGQRTLTLGQQIKDANGDPQELRKISREQFKTNSGYMEVIDYFKNMFFYRYIVVPSYKGMGEKASNEKLLEITRQMLDVVDALSIETLFPQIIEKGLVDGVVYLYTYKKNGLPNIMVLPESYCQRYRQTNYNTETILFDFHYFVDIESRARKQGMEISEKELLSMYPRGLIKQYREYRSENGELNNDKRYQELNIQVAAAIPFHSEGVPPKILVAGAKEVYDVTVATEQKRSKGQIDSILSMEIPLDGDGVPLFDSTEAGAIQKLMASQLSGIDGLKVFTPFGKAQILKPQNNESVKNEAIGKAYDQIFHEALINPKVFTSDSNYAIEMSYSRDSAFVWTLIQKIMTYFNLSLNKTYDFGSYSIYTQLLPITHYNWQRKEEAARRNGEYGIGRLEAVISTGIKQSLIFDKAALEEALNLDEILKPLQSSHTRSSKDDEKKSEVVDKKDDDDQKSSEKREEDEQEE